MAAVKRDRTVKELLAQRVGALTLEVAELNAIIRSMSPNEVPTLE